MINRGEVSASSGRLSVHGSFRNMPDALIRADGGDVLFTNETRWEGGVITLSAGAACTLGTGTHTFGADDAGDAFDLRVVGGSPETDRLMVESGHLNIHSGSLSARDARIVFGNVALIRVDADAAFTIGTERAILELNGCSWMIDGSCDVRGDVVWTDGRLGGLGAFRQTAGAIVLPGSGDHRLSVRSCSIAGTMYVGSGAKLTIESGQEDPVVLSIEKGGTLQLAADSMVQGSAYTWGMSTLRNAGILRMDGDGEARMDAHIRLQHLGDLIVAAGSLVVGLMDAHHAATTRVTMNLAKQGVPLTVERGSVDGSLVITVEGEWPDDDTDHVTIVRLDDTTGRFTEIKIVAPSDLMSQLTATQHEHAVELIRRIR